MAVAGLRGTGDWGTDERPKNFREYILWRDPNGQAPLTALGARMRSESVNDPEFNWWEEELNPIRVQVNGAVTTGQTSVVIDSGDAQDLVAGDLLFVEQGAATGASAISTSFDNEFVEVSSVTNATTFVVSRGAANTSAATIADNSYLTKIGNVYGEGTASPTASTRNPTKYLNYCQIFKTAYELTKTTEKTYARTGPALQNDKKRKMFDHSVALEYAAIWGKPYETTGSNGKPKRFTGGMLNYLKTAYDAGSTHCIKIWTTTATEDDFLDATYKMWDYSTGGRGAGTERIGLCGNGFLNRLNKMARASTSTRINFDGTVKTYGMELQRFILPQGTLYLRSHPLFNVHGNFTNSALFLHAGGIVERPLRSTRPQDNIQGNDEDTHKGQWLTETGYEFHHLKTMQYQGDFHLTA